MNGTAISRVAIGRIAAWAPGLGSLASAKEQWQAWAAGKADINDTADAPALEFTDPLFRRRLSQLTRMTIQVVHDLTEEDEDLRQLPLVFVSFRGELAQQYKINKMLVEDSSLTPAAFSHSVFNTPIALACIAMNLTAGYQALYPAAGKDAFRTALLSAAAPVLCGEKGIILVYGDERITDGYAALKETAPGPAFPLAFAVELRSSSRVSGDVQSEGNRRFPELRSAELRPAAAIAGMSPSDLFRGLDAPDPYEFLKYCLNIR